MFVIGNNVIPASSPINDLGKIHSRSVVVARFLICYYLEDFINDIQLNYAEFVKLKVHIFKLSKSYFYCYLDLQFFP